MKIPEEYREARKRAWEKGKKSPQLGLEEIVLRAQRLEEAMDIEKAWDPDQPRAPAGSSAGGQWTGGGGSSSSKPTLDDLMDAAEKQADLSFVKDKTAHRVTRENVQLRVEQLAAVATEMFSITYMKNQLKAINIIGRLKAVRKLIPLARYREMIIPQIEKVIGGML